MANKGEKPEHFLWSKSEIEISRFHGKMAKFGEIRIFQFLTDFTKNALASHIVKAQKCTAPLWKAGKIAIIWGIKKFSAREIYVTI